MKEKTYVSAAVFDVVFLLTFQAEGETEVLVAGDPERKHMALCDKLGGIPYHKNQIIFAVSIPLLSIPTHSEHII